MLSATAAREGWPSLRRLRRRHRTRLTGRLVRPTPLTCVFVILAPRRSANGPQRFQRAVASRSGHLPQGRGRRAASAEAVLPATVTRVVRDRAADGVLGARTGRRRRHRQAAAADGAAAAHLPPGRAYPRV